MQNNSTNKNITKINLTALGKINDFFTNKMDQSGDNDKKLFIETNFDGYSSLMWDIETLLRVIEGLALSSCVPDSEKLDSIGALSRLLQKIIPRDDMVAMDKLFLADNSSKSSDFISIEELTELVK